jgi:hypothetical protein
MPRCGRIPADDDLDQLPRRRLVRHEERPGNHVRSDVVDQSLKVARSQQIAADDDPSAGTVDPGRRDSAGEVGGCGGEEADGHLAPGGIRQAFGHDPAGRDRPRIARAGDGEHDLVVVTEPRLRESLAEHHDDALVRTQRAGEHHGTAGLGQHRLGQIHVHVVARRQEHRHDDGRKPRGEGSQRRRRVRLLHVDESRGDSEAGSGRGHGAHQPGDRGLAIRRRRAVGDPDERWGSLGAHPTILPGRAVGITPDVTAGPEP